MASLNSRLVVVGMLLLCASFVSAGPVRVRKELRSLSQKEKQQFITALSTMLTIATSEGQVLYGPNYREYDYFVVKHAVAVYDPRGDQGHAGPCFMTFHRSLLLEFEAAVLSVAPELNALPYWDLTLDTRGGKYSNTSDPNYIFSKNWSGSVPGNAKQGYTNSDGLFAWREISSFNNETYGTYSNIYSGSLSTGLLRSPTNNNTNIFTTRYLYSNTPDGKASCVNSILLPDRQPNEFNINYKEEDYRFCHSPSLVSNWMDWHECVDFDTIAASGPICSANHCRIQMLTSSHHHIMKCYSPPSATCRMLNITRAPILHTIAHLWVGGMTPDRTEGDFADTATSPNEVLLFMTHHANMDRSNMIWQANSAALNATLASPDVLWTYPTTAAQWRTNRTGCFLDDVLNSAFGFTNIFPGKTPASPLGYTHKEVLLNSLPGQVEYTYDNMFTSPPVQKRRSLRSMLAV